MAQMIKETTKKSDEKKPERKTGGQKKRGIDKWKKKVWYSIFTPDEFEKREIAQTVAEKPEMVMGRTLTVSVAEVSKQPRMSHVALRFQGPRSRRPKKPRFEKSWKKNVKKRPRRANSACWSKNLFLAMSRPRS